MNKKLFHSDVNLHRNNILYRDSVLNENNLKAFSSVLNELHKPYLTLVGGVLMMGHMHLLVSMDP